MSWLAAYSLRLLHLIYSFVLAVSSFHGRWLKSNPNPLEAHRSKTPEHLGITLVCGETQVGDERVREAFVLSVERAATWCRTVGIGRLTVYDRTGLLFSVSDTLQRRLCLLDGPSTAGAPKVEMVYPLTPPLSDDSDSQVSDDYLDDGAGAAVITIYPISQDLHSRKKSGLGNGARRRNLRRTSKSHSKPFTVHVASQEAGKPAIAAIANRLVRELKQTSEMTASDDASPLRLSVDNLQYMLEGESGLLAPDLLIVHHVTRPARQTLPLELHAFPPWQIRLTEFYYDGSWGIRRRLLRSVLDHITPCALLSEVEFRRALDEYSKAEFRAGS
ncbi:hypothetical protein OF83DRAFT_1092217 [Amylostereum chailletii]|nr:hypothetical protein OF83DRAFT_1092217 [Amylostereum chailletii]